MLSEAAGTVAIIGGGPVGLWVAAQTRMRCPHVRVVVFEKYETYGRRHVLRLEPRSLRTPLRTTDSRLAEFCDRLPPVIRTQELEDQLQNLAHSCGVEIRTRHEVLEPDDGKLLAEFRDDPAGLVAVVGADGAHSTVRKTLFADAISTYEEVMYACELKYEAVDDTRALVPISEAYPTLKLLNHAAQEYVGRAREGRTPVTLRIIVSAAEFIELSGATFKKPWHLAQDEDRSHVPASVLESITRWLNARQSFAGETRVPGSELLSVTSLAPYRSAAFVRRRAIGRAVPALLVGDAAFGVPFFRSANNGFLCGTQAAACLAQLATATGDDTIKEQSLDDYARYVERLATREIRTARRKRTMLETAKWWCQVSGLVPWQVNRWTRQQIEDLNSPLVFPEF